MLVGYFGEIAQQRTVGYHIMFVFRLTHSVPHYYGAISLKQNSTENRCVRVSPELTASVEDMYRILYSNTGTHILYDMFGGKDARPVLYSMNDERMRKWKRVELSGTASAVCPVIPPKPTFTMPFMDMGPMSCVNVASATFIQFCKEMDVYRRFDTPANLCSALILANETAMKHDTIKRFTFEGAKEALLDLGGRKTQVELDL